MENPYFTKKVQETLAIEKLANSKPLSIDEIISNSHQINLRIIQRIVTTFLNGLKIDHVSLRNESSQNKLFYINLMLFLRTAMVGEKTNIFNEEAVRKMILHTKILEEKEIEDSRIKIELRNEILVNEQTYKVHEHQSDNLIDLIYENEKMIFSFNGVDFNIRWKYFQEDILTTFNHVVENDVMLTEL